MPTYDYLCKKCGLNFEHFQTMFDLPLTDCPSCGSSVRRLISGGTGLIFKGTGFYLTDYKKKSNSKDTTIKNKPKPKSKEDTETKTKKKDS